MADLLTDNHIAVVDEDKRDVVLLLNPKAGRGSSKEQVDQLCSELEKRGFRCHSDTNLSSFTETVERLHQKGNLRTVVSVGGDGTISLLLNTIASDIPITIFPQGTENVLAKYLKQPKQVSRLADIIEKGNYAVLDVGVQNEQRFSLMASVGIDSQVVHTLHAKRSGHIRHWSYIWPSIKSAIRYRYPKVRVLAYDNRGTQIADELGKWVLVFNTPLYARKLKFCRDGDPTDSKLDVCVFSGGTLFHMMWYICAVMLGFHHKLKSTKIFTASHVELTSEESEVCVQVDGDPAGTLPITCDCITGEMRLMIQVTDNST